MADAMKQVTEAQTFLKYMGIKPRAFYNEPEDQPYIVTLTNVINNEVDDIYAWDKIKLYTWIADEYDEEVQACFEEVMQKDLLGLGGNMQGYTFLDHSASALTVNYLHKFKEYTEELIAMFIYDALTELGIKRKSVKVYGLISDATEHLMATQNYETLTMKQIKEVAKKIKEMK